ncbi:MAG: hypothetical protein OXH57_10465 [Ekhidna sp.]|nr:hypothetical protein [Ekhidna sp.]
MVVLSVSAQPKIKFRYALGSGQAWILDSAANESAFRADVRV